MTDETHEVVPTESDSGENLVIKIGMPILVAGLFAIFVVQNAQTVEIEFLWWSFDASQIVLILGSAVAGVVLWQLFGFVRRRDIAARHRTGAD